MVMEHTKIESPLGTVRIADEVVEVIAGMAASEVEGVAALSGGFVGDLANILGRGKSASKGIKVEVGEKDATVDLFIAVEYGISIPTVSLKVQEAVKGAIEGMTGLAVVEINVHVQSITMKNISEVKESKEG